jgi:hypothetical protein
MPAFSPRRTGMVQENIKALFDRSLKFKRSGLSHQDLLELFVEPEHRKMVVEVVKICGVGGDCHFSAKVKGAALWINTTTTDDAPGFAAPEYMGKRIFEKGEARERLLAWVNWRVTLGHDWGLVLATFNQLQEQCDTAQTLRFFWPPVVALLGMSEDLAGAADKIGNYKTPSNIPRLHPALLEACRSTAGTIARAMLLPDPSKVTPEPDKEVSISCRDYELAPLPWADALKVPMM